MKSVRKTEDEEKRTSRDLCTEVKMHSQSDAQLRLAALLSDEPLDLFVGLPRQRNAIPLQDLHS